MDLYDLIDRAQLEHAVASRHVTVKPHRELPLRILNYTSECMYSKVWNPTTMQCRGLIVDDADQVVARPWAKAFNHGDPMTGPLDLAAPVEVTDKLDGCLGVLYRGGDGWAIATRGSFHSDQADRATKVLHAKYPDFEPVPGWTYLFEVILPEFRIVIGYGDTEDLFLLGIRDTETGDTYGPGLGVDVDGWPGPRTTVFEYATLTDALAMPPRDDVEGVVVRYLDTGKQVKLKTAAYTALHAVIFNCSARRLWEMLAVEACHAAGHSAKNMVHRLHTDPKRIEQVLATGGGMQSVLVAGIPDEFHGWVLDTIARMAAGVAQLGAEIHAESNELRSCGWARKELAEMLADNPRKGPLFDLLDGIDIVPWLWLQVEPNGTDRPFARSEDVA